MAIIRAMLRTQRLDGMKNVLGSPDGCNPRKHPFSQNPRLLHGHELDLLALHLHKIDTLTASAARDVGLEKIVVDRDSKRTIQLDGYEFDYKTGGPRSFENVAGPLETRIQLAKITSKGKGPSWEDLKTRVVAGKLLAAIEGVMEVISLLQGFSASPSDVSKWSIALDSVPLADRSSPTVLWNDGAENTRDQPSQVLPPSANRVPPTVQPPELFDLYIEKGDGVSWIGDLKELEAIIGLWALSIFIFDIRASKQDKIIRNHRLISTKDQGSMGDLRYRDDERQCIVDTHLFGKLDPLKSQFDTNEEEPVAFHARTYNQTIEMCAHDIFIFSSPLCEKFQISEGRQNPERIPEPTGQN
ncbi:hypothetical protein TWF696_005453 [Orbilia brochopaga]|uniref:Uncharacterized protein n=1 Tax=Orbilia brochopaga TaxID=3140254 RepID=A0AAV9V1S8_9PEZI